MTDLFGDIIKLYGNSFSEHGDSPKSLLTPKGRNDLRFRAIDPFVTKRAVTVFDYGCGLGYLYNYLRSRAKEVNYTGADILPEFIDSCRKNYTEAQFLHLNPWQDLTGNYDVTFSSGVFNLQSHDNPDESRAYAFDRIKKLFHLSNDVFICDFMSSFVDYKQPGAQHFSMAEISEFCIANFGRRFQIRHDLLPYEFTLIVWKNQSIQRPENIFASDA